MAAGQAAPQGPEVGDLRIHPFGKEKKHLPQKPSFSGLICRSSGVFFALMWPMLDYYNVFLWVCICVFLFCDGGGGLFLRIVLGLG